MHQKVVHPQAGDQVALALVCVKEVCSSHSMSSWILSFLILSP
jgi:hypothetical protein